MTDQKKIIELALEEQIAANEQYPLFHSPHEAYAVLAEEVDEMFHEAEWVKTKLRMMWEDVKNDEPIDEKAKEIRQKALLAAQEAIQVMAMCNKIIQSGLY